METPRAFIQRAAFEAAVEQAAQSLAPEVVRIIPTFGADSSEEPAVFLSVILADSVLASAELGRIANQISWDFVRKVWPAQEWGVRPHFYFHSAADAARLPQGVPA